MTETLNSKRVVFPFGRGGIGGSYFSSAQLAKYLREESEYEPIVLALKGGENRRLFDQYDLRVLEHRIHIRNFSNASLVTRLVNRVSKPFVLWSNVIRAVFILFRLKPQLVHIHDDHSALVWATAAKWLRIKTIWHVRQEKRRLTDRERSDLFDRIICISKGCVWRFQELPQVLEKVEVVYNGINLLEFSARTSLSSKGFRSEWDISPHSVVLGFIGNLVARKRPEWAVSALQKLQDSGIDAHLIIIGEERASPSFQSQMSERANWKNWAPKVHFLGLRDDIPALLGVVDIILVPSERHGEPFSRVIAEACASGLPVVACEGIGALELLKNDVDCIICDHADKDAFIQSVVDLGGDEPKRARIGANAAAIAKDVFSYQRMGRETISVYDQLLNSSGVSESE